MHSVSRICTCVFTSLLIIAVSATAQTHSFSSSYISADESSFSSSNGIGAQPSLSRDQTIRRPIRPFSTVGIAVTLGTLGIGGQIATPLAQRANLRVGGNFFSYTSPNYNEDGITFDANIKLRSAQATLDWFPFGNGFHISPGVQLYNGFGGSANLLVPSGQGFELNKVDYVSSASSPLTGTGTVVANKVAPMLLIGWGNLIPRGRGHFSVPFEVGATYQGSPQVKMNFTGTACDTDEENCKPVATDPEFQANQAAQQKKINSEASGYRYYPIISLGFGYRF